MTTNRIIHLFVGLIVSGLAALSTPSSAESPPPFIRTWGTLGAGPGQFSGPYGVAVSPSGLIYVTDQYNHRVEIFTGVGEFVGQFGTFGSGPGQFNNPYGIAVSADGSVYVADRENRRIEKFSATGSFLMEWDGAASAGGAFEYPFGVAVGPDGNLLIADGRRNLVLKYSADGQYIASFSVLNWPEGIAIESDGRFWVTSGDDKVTQYAPDGTLLRQLNVYSGPVGLALDANGALYVVEHSTYTVDKYSSTGQLLVTWGGPGAGPGQFMEPACIAIDQSGLIYISDIANNRIQVFGDSPVPANPTTWGRVKAAYRE